MRRADPRTITYESLEPKLRTGDVFLFHGKSAISKTIERGTRSRFSHAAMVVRPHRSRRPYLWQTGPVKIVGDRLTRTDHGGAQLGDLREALLLMTDPSYADQPYVRRMHVRRTPDFEALAMMVVADIDGRPFPKMTQMLRQWKAGQRRVDESDRTLFCAELVAETLMRMGLLLLDPPPNAYSPQHFSEQYRRLHLQKGASLGPEFKVARPRVR
jgi:hypothetical protein